MLVTVLVLLGCVVLLGAWRAGGLDEGPVPPPPGLGSSSAEPSTP